MAPDIMHDILEGVLQLNIMMVLKEFIVKRGLFTIQELNSRIRSFPFGPQASRPVPFKLTAFTEMSMKQSASQTWCLARYLPLLIGDKVPDNDKHWENFLQLQEIVDYVFAPTTTNAIIDYLTVLIEDYLVDFRALYPDRRLTPKMHYLIHVPSWMRRYGPLIRVWCMRYEAKHSNLKQKANAVKNFKNIAWSLSNHHQRLMCYLMASNYLKQTTHYGQVKETSLEDLQCAADLLSECGIHDGSTMHKTTFAEINGTKYSIGTIVLAQFDEHEMPVFGKITNIVLTTTQDCLFIMSVYESTSFNTHFYSYEVEGTGNCLIKTQDEFADYHPLIMSKNYTVSSPLFIRLKYDVLM